MRRYKLSAQNRLLKKKERSFDLTQDDWSECFAGLEISSSTIELMLNFS
jgi:hypothetical protein